MSLSSIYKLFNIRVLVILAMGATGVFANNTPFHYESEDEDTVLRVNPPLINADNALNIQNTIQGIEALYQNYLAERMELLEANPDLAERLIAQINNELENVAKWLRQANNLFGILLRELTDEVRIPQENHFGEALNQIKIWLTLVDTTLSDIRAENFKADILKRIHNGRALHAAYLARLQNLAKDNSDLAFVIDNRLHAFNAWLDIAEDALNQINQQLGDDARHEQVNRLRIALERQDFVRHRVEETLAEMEARGFFELHRQMIGTEAVVANRTLAMEDDDGPVMPSLREAAVGHDNRNNVIINHRAFPQEQGGCGGGFF